MSDELRSRLEEFTEKAIAIRFSFSIPEYGVGVIELHNSLVTIQELLSDLEKILSDAIRAKAALDRKEAHLKMVWQEAFDKALTKKKIGFTDDFISGKEKSAEANLASFNEARALRFIQEDKSFADEAVEVIRLHYYGLDKIRQDIRKRLDLSQTEYFS